jgi:predicted ATP-dependent protease
MARVIEHGTRMANGSEKLSTYVKDIADLLRETNHCAIIANQQVVHRDNIQQAIDV